MKEFGADVKPKVVCTYNNFTLLTSLLYDLAIVSFIVGPGPVALYSYIPATLAEHNLLLHIMYSMEFLHLNAF